MRGANWTGRTAISWHRLQISEIYTAALQEIITLSSDIGGDGDLIADSSGYGVARYVNWTKAKYGKASVKLFARLHALQSKRGRICAAAVSKGTANDSPYPKRMISAMPPGCGIVTADAAYGRKKNCGAARDSGRKPAMRPKKNYSVRGSGARAEMLQFYGEHPRTFHNALRDRNNVENGFSVMKERFGAVVRALAGRTQSVEMSSIVICFNMLARGSCPQSGAEPRPLRLCGGCARRAVDRRYDGPATVRA